MQHDFIFKSSTLLASIRISPWFFCEIQTCKQEISSSYIAYIPWGE